MRKYYDGLSKDQTKKIKPKKNSLGSSNKPVNRNSKKENNNKDSELSSESNRVNRNELELLPSKAVPQKFIQPITFHVIYGDFGLFDNDIYKTPYEQPAATGVMSVLNLYKKVATVSQNRSYKTVSVEIVNRTENTPKGSWRLLCERLRSQSCVDAKELSDLVEAYCLGFEKEMERRSKEESTNQTLRVSPSITNREKAEHDQRSMEMLHESGCKYYLMLECHYDESFSFF